MTCTATVGLARAPASSLGSSSSLAFTLASAHCSWQVLEAEGADKAKVCSARSHLRMVLTCPVIPIRVYCVYFWGPP